MRAVAQAHRGARAAHFLDRDDVLEVAEPEPAVGLGHGDPVQPQFTHRRPQVARELVLAVDFLGARGDHLVGEAGDGLADHRRLLAEAEVEIGGRAHRKILSPRP